MTAKPVIDIDLLQKACPILWEAFDMMSPNELTGSFPEYIKGYIAGLQALVRGVKSSEITSETSAHELAEFLWGEEIES